MPPLSQELVTAPVFSFSHIAVPTCREGDAANLKFIYKLQVTACVTCSWLHPAEGGLPKMIVQNNKPNCISSVPWAKEIQIVTLIESITSAVAGRTPQINTKKGQGSRRLLYFKSISHTKKEYPENCWNLDLKWNCMNQLSSPGQLLAQGNTGTSQSKKQKSTRPECHDQKLYCCSTSLSPNLTTNFIISAL